ncbi:MAG TPA: hypothetical protein VMN56_08915 [Casimicrobiaceae bacterium]|nr:hypothetical protein [Casimicrobiaceae bacterium]
MDAVPTARTFRRWSCRESSTDHLVRIASSRFTLLYKPVAPAKLLAALAFAIGRPATDS